MFIFDSVKLSIIVSLSFIRATCFWSWLSHFIYSTDKKCLLSNCVNSHSNKSITVFIAVALVELVVGLVACDDAIDEQNLFCCHCCCWLCCHRRSNIQHFNLSLTEKLDHFEETWQKVYLLLLIFCWLAAWR